MLIFSMAHAFETEPTNLSLLQKIYDIRRQEIKIDDLPIERQPIENTKLRREHTEPWAYNYLYHVMKNLQQVQENILSRYPAQDIHRRVLEIKNKRLKEMQLSDPLGRTLDELGTDARNFIYTRTKALAGMFELPIRLTEQNPDLEPCWSNFPVELIVLIEQTGSPVRKVILGVAGWEFNHLMEKDGGMVQILKWKRRCAATQEDIPLLAKGNAFGS